MTRKLTLLFSLLAVFTLVAMAADVTGKWTAQVPGRQGNTREVTFTFKADGAALTGSMTGRQGAEIPISDGKVSGNDISFNVTMNFNGNEIKQSFTGTVAGDEIKMKRAGGQGEPIEFTAKRAK